MVKFSTFSSCFGEHVILVSRCFVKWQKKPKIKRNIPYPSTCARSFHLWTQTCLMETNSMLATFDRFCDRGVILYFTRKLPLVSWIKQWLNSFIMPNCVEDMYVVPRGFYNVVFRSSEHCTALMAKVPIFFDRRFVNVMQWVPVLDYKDLVKYTVQFGWPLIVATHSFGIYYKDWCLKLVKFWLQLLLIRWTNVDFACYGIQVVNFQGGWVLIHLDLVDFVLSFNGKLLQDIV